MSRAAFLILLALCSHGLLLAQSFSSNAAAEGARQGEGIASSPAIGVAATPPASALLPAAPSSISPSPQQDTVALSPSYRPTWAVDRSRLGAKLRYGAASMASVRPLLEAILITGIPNITSPPQQPTFSPGEDSGLYQRLMSTYGDQTNAWLRTTDTTLRAHGYRFEVGLATAETRQLLSNLVLPIALHQDARYRPAAIDASLSQRMAIAARSIVLTEDDHGRIVPNYSKLGGTIAAGFLGSSLYASAVDGTSLDTTRFTLKYVNYSLAGDLATNVTHELLRAAVSNDMQMYHMHGRPTEDSYYPQSVGAKILGWAHSTYSARTFVSAALLAGLPAIHDEPTEPRPNQPSTFNGYPDYATAYDAWGSAELAWKDDLQSNVRMHARRLAGGLAETETQVLLQNLMMPVGFDIDARYIPLGPEHDASERLGHTFTSLVNARTDQGGHTINLPLLAGTVGAAFAAKELYYPQLGTPALETNAVLATTIGLNLLADLIGNVRSEFSHRQHY